jgi:hypothetical protein
MYYELKNQESKETLGLVKVTNLQECYVEKTNYKNEVEESWDTYNNLHTTFKLEDFVLWHNQNKFTQLESFKVETIAPHYYA